MKAGNKDQNFSLEAERSFYEGRFVTIFPRKTRFRFAPGRLSSALYAFYLQTNLIARRERFWKKYLPASNVKSQILDVGCGGGNEYFAHAGTATGLDISLTSLSVARQVYCERVAQGNILDLPFCDQSFDYVVSADLLGHILSQQKDKSLNEFFRVLKPDGKMLHVIETKSQAPLFRFAERFSDLFQEHFVIRIGGHYGLELPTQCVMRLERAGFQMLRTEKIYDFLMPLWSFVFLFDNQYRTKNLFLSWAVDVSKLLLRSRFLTHAVDMIFGIITDLIRPLTGLDTAMGLLVFCEKVRLTCMWELED